LNSTRRNSATQKSEQKIDPLKSGEKSGQHHYYILIHIILIYIILGGGLFQILYIYMLKFEMVNVDFDSVNTLILGGYR
jgi:hypothetical protein